MEAKFKRGDKVNYIGSGSHYSVKGTYVWAINPHEFLQYVIEHKDGFPKEYFMASFGRDGFEAIRSKDLVEGKKYIYTCEANLEMVDPAKPKDPLWVDVIADSVNASKYFMENEVRGNLENFETKTVDMNYDELIAKRDALQEEVSKLDKEIEGMTQNDRIIKNSAFIGKCYSEIQDANYDDSWRVFYVYALSGDREFLSVEVNYWMTEYPSSFGIESNTYFDPRKKDHDNGNERYEEISFDEFKKHYSEVQRRQNKLIPPINE